MAIGLILHCLFSSSGLESLLHLPAVQRYSVVYKHLLLLCLGHRPHVYCINSNLAVHH